MTEVKALAFDIFGTVVDWRSSVSEELSMRAHRKMGSSISDDLKYKVESMSWPTFAQAWRDSYVTFTKNYDPSKDEWKTVDEHHHDSLRDLLDTHDLKGLYSDAEIESLSLVWHRLTPWSDSSEGLEKLSTRYTTSTLSNGNTDLLADLTDFGELKFYELFSAETFKAYKPNPATYLGVAEKLDLQPHQLAMVAAHLGDLKSARKCGLRTIYVERKEEEAWEKTEQRYQEAKNWVDLWVTEKEDGLLTVARKLAEL